ncbi:class I adenylate-forming enzyme family protein [Bacteroides sp. 519]|uniref:class I adenylate-forming enzyme family protein n=1 Tax=Bacteroides sp. 519 TaxID=2302937 RepID=UPI0013D5248E|nr:class I adenylate-forming enzyme family protein [Bacteroides sp. 519]NDV57980.1 hypothetical protein [Bacteroides sp. 519]
MYNTMMHSVYNILLKNKLSTPQKNALIVKNISYSYECIWNNTVSFSNYLLKNNFQIGDRVVFYGHNSMEFIVSLFGTIKSRGVFVPISPNQTIPNLKHIISDCSPQYILIEYNCVNEDLILFFDKLHVKYLIINGVCDKDSFELIIDSNDARDVNTQNCDCSNDLALLIYTSGTTRFPKGVMSLNKQILFVTKAINSVIQNNSEDKILCGLPFSFDYGLYQIFLSFSAGATLIIEDFYYIMSIPQYLIKHEITGFPVVPSIIISLVSSGCFSKINFPYLRYISSTGDVLPKEIILKIKTIQPKVAILPMYGLTECKRVSILPYQYIDNHESSVGLPLPGTEIEIINDFGEKAKPYETGELIVKGEHVMLGYWNNKKESDLKFRKDKSGENILYTGDLFHVDSDGFLYFEGRKEHYIKSRGQKISPIDIESVFSSIEYVDSCIAVGVPDYVLGEAIYIYVKVKNEISVDKSKIIQDCQNILPKEYFPKYIEIIENIFPLNNNGKIDRKHLKKIAIDKVKDDV